MTKRKTLRRSLGAICLMGAVVMLALGETNPAATDSQLRYLVYWLTCLLLVLMAMLMALIDMLAVRREARQAQRHLFEQTLEQIQAKPAQRQGQSPAGTNLKD